MSGKFTKAKEDMIAGAFAGGLAKLLTAPLDVIKIRYQLQYGNTKKYTSMLQAVSTVVKEEGIWGLWKGNLSATYLWVTYSMIQFSIYGALKSAGEKLPNPFDSSSNFNPNHHQIDGTYRSGLWKTFILFLAGAGAGIVATTATYPFDIMRTQFAIQLINAIFGRLSHAFVISKGNSKAYGTMSSFVIQTMQSKGIPGFYAGLPAAVIGIAPYIGLNFAIYETLKSSTTFIGGKTVTANIPYLSASKNDSSAWSVLRNSVCGGVAGGVSKLVVFPLDTIKKRMQAQVLKNTLDGMGSLPRYSSMSHCLVDTLRTEGIKGLYKGVIPTTYKAVVGAALTFAIYDATKDLLRLNRVDSRQSRGRSNS